MCPACLNLFLCTFTWQDIIRRKKVLPHDRKMHTARSVSCPWCILAGGRGEVRGEWVPLFLPCLGVVPHTGPKWKERRPETRGTLSPRKNLEPEIAVPLPILCKGPNTRGGGNPSLVPPGERTNKLKTLPSLILWMQGDKRMIGHTVARSKLWELTIKDGEEVMELM